MINTTMTGRGFVSFLQLANRIVDGNLGAGWLLMIMVITFIVSKNFTNKRAALVGTYFSMVMAVLFRLMQILSDRVMFISFGCFILCLIWVYLQED